jgi:predicted Fe-Mo cluster-binding NifX family protein
MEICVTATAGDLDAQVDPRFGRCLYFVIVDAETMKFEAIPNTALGAMGGAGIQAAQTVASKGVEALITGNVGPNAFQALSAAGVKIITGAFGTVREVIERYKRGELRGGTSVPTVRGHFGMGRGRGRGGRRQG